MGATDELIGYIVGAGVIANSLGYARARLRTRPKRTRTKTTLTQVAQMQAAADRADAEPTPTTPSDLPRETLLRWQHTAASPTHGAVHARTEPMPTT